MDMNVPPDMTVHIACTQRRDTNTMPLWRTQWEVVCYTSNYDNHTVPNALIEGVGREKGVVKQVSFEKY